MSLIDFALGVALLAIVPFFLAAYGGQIAAETLNDPRSRRNAKVKFWGMFAVGVLIAAMYQYRTQKADEEKQRKTEVAQQTALLAEGQLEAREKSNGELIQSLQNRLEKVLSHPQSQEQRIALLKLRDELSKDLAEKLKVQNTSANQALPNNPVSVPIAKPCRGDNLRDCGDRELLEWGKELLARMKVISDNYMAAVEALNKSKADAKWLEMNAQANEAAADRFRDCCAADAVKYHREVALRVGGGHEDVGFYEWAQKLLSPVQSDEWKAARENSGYRVVDNYYNLEILCRNLDLKIRLAEIKQMH